MAAKKMKFFNRVSLEIVFRKAFNSVKFAREEICDYIFPKICFGCREEVGYLCSACFDKIKYLTDFSCFLCHRPNVVSGICADCSKQSGIDQIVVATAYTENFVSSLVEGLKYTFIEELAAPLANILIKQISRRGLKNSFSQSVLVPIPLHKKRLLERGFNQAEELAKLVALKYDIQVDTRLIQRSRATAQQAKLSRAERLENMQGAFCVNPEIKLPNTVILIDDVLTTGTTFVEAAKCLKSAGVSKIICLAVCHG